MRYDDTPTPFVSERHRLEAERRDRIEAFDKFVDLALDGVITVEQAISGFKEEYGYQYEATPLPVAR